MTHRAFDVLGNIAIVNFPLGFKLKEKKRFADKILKNQKNIRTVLEKSGKIKGRLRKISTEHIAGEKTKEVLYKENGCVFRFNIDTTYFSSRLSNERKEIAKKIKKGEEVLVMFAGVSPYSIVIAKNSKAKKIYSNEINRVANKYAKLNLELNKVKDRVELVPGDIKRLVKTGKLKEKNTKKSKISCATKSRAVSTHRTVLKDFVGFDVIVMPRPRLKNSFLKEAFYLSKKGTRIFYYDFCSAGEENKIIEKIKDEASRAKKKIRILKVKKAGEIAPFKIRLRVDFKIV